MWDKLKKLMGGGETPNAPAADQARPVPAGSTYVPPDQEAGKRYKVEDFQRPALEAGSVEKITSKAITGFLDAIAPPTTGRTGGTGPLGEPEEEELDGLADIKLDMMKPKRKRRAPLDLSSIPAPGEPDAEGYITIVEEDALGNQVTKRIKPQVAGEGGALRLDDADGLPPLPPL